MEFEADYGATGGLMMWIKNTMFGTGKTVMTNSGFCVLKV